MAKKENKDKVVAELQEIVKTKKAEIASIERPNYKTHMSLNIGNGSVNLNTVTDPFVLGTSLGTLLRLKADYSAAAEILGFNETYKHQGFPVEDWVDDIQARFEKVTINQKKQQLEIIEKRLAALESKESREEKELKEIQSLLNK